MTYNYSQIAENSISEVLNFKIFPWEHVPGPPQDRSRLRRNDRTYGVTWRDLYFKLATPLFMLLMKLLEFRMLKLLQLSAGVFLLFFSF